MEVRTWLGRAAIVGAALLLSACDSGKSDDNSQRPDPAKPGASPATSLGAPEDVAAPPAGAETSASGLAWKILQPGTGKEHPGMNDFVEVHYTGWTPQGKMFDSSVARGETTRFPLGRVIKGWTEGLQLMTVGEKRRFWIPGKLAYGDTPTRPGTLAGMLVFDVELISFRALPPPAAAPTLVPASDTTSPRLKTEKARGKSPASESSKR